MAAAVTRSVSMTEPSSGMRAGSCAKREFVSLLENSTPNRYLTCSAEDARLAQHFEMIDEFLELVWVDRVGSGYGRAVDDCLVDYRTRYVPAGGRRVVGLRRFVSKVTNIPERSFITVELISHNGMHFTANLLADGRPVGHPLHVTRLVDVFLALAEVVFNYSSKNLRDVRIVAFLTARDLSKQQFPLRWTGAVNQDLFAHARIWSRVWGINITIDVDEDATF